MQDWPGRKAVAELVLPVLLAPIGCAAAVKWKVEIGVMHMVKDVLHQKHARNSLVCRCSR